MDYNNPHYVSQEQWDAERKIEKLTSRLNEGWKFYSRHETLISANETVSILFNKTNYADIWGGYKIVKEKDGYVLYIAEKGETNE